MRPIITNASEMRKKAAPLFCVFDNQTSPQSAFIAVNPRSRTLCADFDGEIGNAKPKAVWYNRIYRLNISECVLGSALADIMEDDDFLSMIDNLIESYHVVEKHDNYWGVWDEELACKIEETLEDLDKATVYSADDYFEPDLERKTDHFVIHTTADDIVIRPDSNRDKIVAELKALIEDPDTIEVYDIDKYVEDLIFEVQLRCDD